MTEHSIANFLKQLRKTSGYSANEVAEKLKSYNIDISSKTLYGYESGLSMLNADVFVALCKIYKCENPMDIFDSPSLKADELSLIEKYRSLDSTGQKHVDTVLQWEVDHMNLLEKKDKTIYDLKHQPDKYPHKIYDLGNIVSMVSESSTPYGSVNAAHDNGATPDQAAAADAIMKEDDEWE